MNNFRHLGTALVLVLLAHFYAPIFCQNSAAPALPPIVEPHTPTTHILTGAERNEFRIESAGNEYLRIRIAQREVALNVILRAPDGREILKTNNSNGRLEQLVFSGLATEPGTYYLVLENPAKPSAPDNSFTITIEEQRTASPDDIKRVAMEGTLLDAEQLRVQGSIESSIKAIQAYEATLPFWRQIGSRRDEANILTTLGQLQASIGQTEKALLYLNQALSVWKTSGDLYQTASTLSDIGLIYNRLDKNLEALENLQESLAIWRTLGDRAREANVLERLGQTYAAFGDTRKALDQYDQALKIWEQLGNREGAAFTLAAIGRLFDGSHDYSKATQYYAQAYLLWDQENNSFGEDYIVEKLKRMLGEKRFKQELETPEKVLVSIRNVEGRVSVVASEQQKKKVTVEAKSVGLASAADDVKVNSKGGKVLIDVQPRGEKNSIDLVVTVPQRSKIEVTGHAGAVDVVGNVESAVVTTDTGTIHADVPLDALKFDFVWEASRPRYMSDVELPPVKEKAGRMFKLSGRLGGKEAKKEETVALDFRTQRGVVLLNVDPAMAPSDLRERPLTEAARAIVRSGDSPLVGAIRIASPKVFGDYAKTLPPEKEPALLRRTPSAGIVSSVEPQLLRFNATVTDRNGRGIRGMRESDFTVSENGVERQVVNVVPANDPFNLVLLLDLSGSVEERREFIVKSARDFLSTTSPQDRISIISFRDDIQIISDFTTDRQMLSRKLEETEAGGGTALYDALGYVLTETLKPLRGERTAIVVISDGNDNKSFLPFPAILEALTESGALVYPLYVPSGLIPESSAPTAAVTMDPLRTRYLTSTMRAEQEGRKLAAASGGTYYPIRRLDDLQKAYDDLVAQLQSTYTITYVSNSGFSTPRLRVRTNRDGASVRLSGAISETATGPRPASKPPISSSEVTLWHQLNSLDDPAGFAIYLNHFPNGRFAYEAKGRLKDFEPLNFKQSLYEENFEGFSALTTKLLAYNAPPVDGDIKIERKPTLEVPDPIVESKEFDVLVSLTTDTGSKTPEVKITQGSEKNRGQLALTLPNLDGWTIEVVLMAPDFVTLEENRATLFLPRTGDSTPARFKLRSKSINGSQQASKIFATFWYKGGFLGKIEREVTVVRGDPVEPVPVTEKIPPAIANTKPQTKIDFNFRQKTPDLTIVTVTSRNSKEREVYVFSPYLKFARSEVYPYSQQDLSDWLRTQYTELSKKSTLLAQSGDVTSRAERSEAAKEFVRGFSLQLYSRFCPPLVKTAFWEVLRANRSNFKTIQIYSDDFDLPWELMQPVNANGEEYGLLGTKFAIGRWHLSPADSGLAKPPQQLSINKLVVIAPTYGVPMQNQQPEIDTLKSMNGYQAWPGKLDDMRRLVKDLPLGIIYFAGHGSILPTDGNFYRYSIQLEDGPLDVMTWRGMITPQAEKHPLFFFNACLVGQTQTIANFVDGWAPAVLDSGASGYVSSLWSVSQSGAADFGATFYREFDRRLKDGAASVAETLMETRKKFQENGDPSFLAYVYFGDADLRLVRMPK